MNKIAMKRGGRCLSETYIDSKTKLQFECEYGHKWYAIPMNIKLGTWCPTCATRDGILYPKGTLEDMQRIARERHGECLSNEYIRSKFKLKWRCEFGHVWNTTPTLIKQGHWCPRCAIERRSKKPFSHRFSSSKQPSS